MPLEFLSKSKFLNIGCAALAGLTLAIAVASTPALAADDEESDDWYDVRIMRKVLNGLGLKRDGAAIDFRERSPLVVPPSRDLPAPDQASNVQNNPAWPKDPDVQRAKQELAARKSPSRARTWEDESRPLSAAEMGRGKKAGAGQQGYSTDPNSEARPYSPAALGSKSAFSWEGLGFGSKKEESAAFTGEPARSNLTQPPVGYQTPSPNQPYGIGPNKGPGKAMTMEERMEDKR